MVLTRNSWRAAACSSALLTVVIGGIAACSSSGTNEVIVSGDLPVLEQTASPLVGTPTGVAKSPEVDPAPAPEATSIGQELTWTEVDFSEVFGPDNDRNSSLESVGDGRVIAHTFGPVGDSLVLATENGVDWAEIHMPAGITPWHIDIAGDRWLVTGWDSSSDVDAFLAFNNFQAFYSDNQGANWTELALGP